MMKLLGNRVGVKLPPMEEKLDTGLWIPPEAQEPAMEGIVMVVGNGPLVQDIKVGDRIVFEQYAGEEIELMEDRDLGDILILEYDDLMMVVDPKEEGHATSQEGGVRGLLH